MGEIDFISCGSSVPCRRVTWKPWSRRGNFEGTTDRFWSYAVAKRSSFLKREGATAIKRLGDTALTLFI